jgi:hypothetical protein
VFERVIREPGRCRLNPIETYTLDGDEYAASGSAEPGTVTTLPAFAPIALDPGTLLRMR